MELVHPVHIISFWHVCLHFSTTAPDMPHPHPLCDILLCHPCCLPILVGLQCTLSTLSITLQLMCHVPHCSEFPWNPSTSQSSIFEVGDTKQTHHRLGHRCCNEKFPFKQCNPDAQPVSHGFGSSFSSCVPRKTSIFWIVRKALIDSLRHCNLKNFAPRWLKDDSTHRARPRLFPSLCEKQQQEQENCYPIAAAPKFRSFRFVKDVETITLRINGSLKLSHAFDCMWKECCPQECNLTICGFGPSPNTRV